MFRALYMYILSLIKSPYYYTLPFFTVYDEGLQKARKKSLSRQQWHQFWPKQKYIKVMVGHAKRGETGDDLSHLFCDKRVVSSQHLILASHLCT